MDVGRAADQKPSMLLTGRRDVIATPHVGGLTPQAAEHQAFDTVRQVGELAAGRMPSGVVNAADGRRFQAFVAGAGVGGVMAGGFDPPPAPP